MTIPRISFSTVDVMLALVLGVIGVVAELSGDKFTAGVAIGAAAGALKTSFSPSSTVPLDPGVST